MSVFVVTWNLNKEGASYDAARTKFFEQLARCDYNYSSKLETTAFVSTASDVDELYRFLKEAVDDNDRLFVSKMHSSCHKGWLDKTQWEWINARVQ